MVQVRELYVPTLRGLFGKWWYYSCLMPAAEVAERISFAKDIHKNENLSDMIQRLIKKKRGHEIAEYLKSNKDKFFNSLVVAVYKGDPTWFEVAITKANKNIPIGDIPNSVLDSFGLLRLSGKEILFALDGQHRLAGIKQAIQDGADLNDEISLVLVAHEDTLQGLRRTRNLFTTLNKTAVSVSKGERIALDENDVMALIARRLVEENPYFIGDRVIYNTTNNLQPGDLRSLTTIGNLYDILRLLFVNILRKGKAKKLEYSRPSDKELGDIYHEACAFFTLLNDNFSELKEYWETKDYSAVVKRNRGEFGGSLVFRPIGLKLVVECIGKMSDKNGVEERLKRISSLPRNIASPPYSGIIWDITEKKMISTKQVLARDIILYLAGENVKKEELEKKYAAALGDEKGVVKLPMPNF